MDDFNIAINRSILININGNKSQKSWEQNTRTFSVQASCGRVVISNLFPLRLPPSLHYWNTISAFLFYPSTSSDAQILARYIFESNTNVHGVAQRNITLFLTVYVTCCRRLRHTARSFARLL